MMRKKVLVTGAGAGVGQGILIALQKYKTKFKIYASDASPYATGLYFTKHAFVTGKLENDSEFEKFLKIIKHYRIEVIFPGNEYDLITLSSKRDLIQDLTGALVICSDPDVIAITNDKWLTYEFCLKNRISTPVTFLVNSLAELEVVHKTIAFPWVIKPRFGTASRGISFVNNYIDAQIALQATEHPLVQEFLQPIDNEFTSEYTCSIFRDKKGKLHGPFIAERNLKSGSTWIAKVLRKESLHDFLFQIADCLEYSGPLNIQLIETEAGPMLLELNCRFSGTTGIRSHFGFNEPEMAVRSFLQNKSLRDAKISEGIVLRYTADVVLNNYNIKKQI